VTTAYWMGVQTIENRKAVGKRRPPGSIRTRHEELMRRDWPRGTISSRWKSSFPTPSHTSRCLERCPDCAHEPEYRHREPLENDIVPVSIPGGEDSALAQTREGDCVAVRAAGGTSIWAAMKFAWMPLRHRSTLRREDVAADLSQRQLLLQPPNSRIVPARDESPERGTSA